MLLATDTAVSRTAQKGFKVLVLSRYEQESVMIGDNIRVMVVEIRGDRVRLGFDVPTTIPVHRHEVYEAIAREHQRAQRDIAKGTE